MNIFIDSSGGRQIALNFFNHGIAIMKVVLDKYWLAPGMIALIVGIYGCTSTSQSLPSKPPSPTSPQSSGNTSNKSNKPADSSSSNASTHAKPTHKQKNESKSDPGKSYGKQATDKGDRTDSAEKEPVHRGTNDDDSPSVSTSPKTDSETLNDIDNALNASIGAFERRLAREKQSVEQSLLEGHQQLPEADAGSHGALDVRHRDTNSTGVGLIPASAAEQRAPAVGIGPGQESRRRAALGGGDEVLVRQLRDAAEGETDPQLRKKLWEEYRKYTGSNAQMTGKK